ncbi:MAG: hypothetical protein HYV09_41130 [Deltaproteobacteria bacterium]|nr:hypothetical protein [Deltaproteobacteria bacterium]
MSDEPKVTRTPTKLRTHFARRALAWSMRLTRLAVYFMFVAGILALVAGRIAYGKAKQAALDMGSELVRLTDASHLSGVNRLRINGELVKISSAVSQQSHQVILDRFQKECEDHADGIAEEFATLTTSLDGAPKNGGFPGVGVLRKDDDTGGVVVCFALGKAAGEAETFGRIAAFAKSGNLADIGHVRYLMAKKGENAPSHVVALWTEGSLDVNKMFPDQGDAPGNDAPGVLRPPSSRRLMTAYAEGAPYGVRVYESTMARDAILAEYDKVMPATGWMVYPRAVEALPFSRAFSKEGHDILVTTEPAQTGTTVSIVEMGSK